MASRGIRDLRQLGVAPRNTPLSTSPVVQRGMAGPLAAAVGGAKMRMGPAAPQPSPSVKTPRARRFI